MKINQNITSNTQEQQVLHYIYLFQSMMNHAKHKHGKLYVKCLKRSSFVNYLLPATATISESVQGTYLILLNHDRHFHAMPIT
jgi:hypothetical protein